LKVPKTNGISQDEIYFSTLAEISAWLRTAL
jgi:hypothetical protein